MDTFIKALDMWIEAAEDRRDKAVSSENYAKALEQDNYAAGLSQAKALYNAVKDDEKRREEEKEDKDKSKKSMFNYMKDS